MLKSNKAPTLSEQVSDVIATTKAYAIQETLDPLRGIGRYLAFGVGGALLVGLGLVMVLLAGLRALQTETGSTFTGNLSWIPYLIVLVVTVALIGLFASRISKHEVSRDAKAKQTGVGR